MRRNRPIFACNRRRMPPSFSVAAARAASRRRAHAAPTRPFSRTAGRRHPARRAAVHRRADPDRVRGWPSVRPRCPRTPGMRPRRLLSPSRCSGAACSNWCAGSACGQLKRYGRTIQLALSWVGLLGFPAGTLISIVILFYLYRPGVKLLFSERAAGEFTAEEAAEIAAVSRGSLGTVIAVAGISHRRVAATGIAAAIAIPGLLRAQHVQQRGSRDRRVAYHQPRAGPLRRAVHGLRPGSVGIEANRPAGVERVARRRDRHPERLSDLAGAGTHRDCRAEPTGRMRRQRQQLLRTRRPGDRRHDGHALLRDSCRRHDLPEHRRINQESDSPGPRRPSSSH